MTITSKVSRFASSQVNASASTIVSFGDDSASVRAFGLDVVTELCARLLDRGAPGLHFYTLNQAWLTSTICQRLGL